MCLFFLFPKLAWRGKSSDRMAAGTTTLVLLAAALGFLGGRRWPTPASGVDERERALRRDGSADVALPSRRLEEATSAGHCKLDRSCAYSIDEDAMVAQVQLVRLPLVPEQFRERIIIELGANTVYTVRDTLLKQPRFKNHFVVSFEPLLDKYASNLAARSKAVMRAALGHHHRRGVILPFAVGPTEGVLDLQVPRMAPRMGHRMAHYMVPRVGHGMGRCTVPRMEGPRQGTGRPRGPHIYIYIYIYVCVCVPNRSSMSHA